jgi:hypothetical protein
MAKSAIHTLGVLFELFLVAHYTLLSTLYYNFQSKSYFMKRIFLIICLVCINIQSSFKGEVAVLNTLLLLTAARKANYSVTDLCARGAQANCVDSKNRTTPLHLAARAVQPERIKELLDAGADPLQKDCEGYTALQRIPSSLPAAHALAHMYISVATEERKKSPKKGSS